MNNRLIVLALLGVGAFMTYRVLTARNKPVKQPATTGASVPADWVKPGSQQANMLAEQTAGF